MNCAKKAQTAGYDGVKVMGSEGYLINPFMSPLIQKLSNAYVMLTSQEMQVTAMVKDGRTTSEIAEVLFVSEATIIFHRKNLRSKLGLKNKQTHLRSFLLSMS